MSTDGWSIAKWFDTVVRAWNGITGKTVVSSMPTGGTKPPIARIAQSRIPSCVTRRGMSRQKLCVWKNQLEPLVLEVLKQNFHPENFARMSMMVSSWGNPLQRIVNETSLVYSNPAKRRIKTTSPVPDEEVPPPEGKSQDQVVWELADVLNLEGSDPTEETPLDAVMKLADLDAVMDMAEKMASFLPCVWIRPVVRYDRTTIQKDEMTGQEETVADTSSGSLAWVIYTPAVADVICDPSNPNRELAWWYEADELDEKTGSIIRVIHFFSQTEYYKFGSDWEVITSAPNPLGIPVVKLQLNETVDGDYYLDGTGDDLFRFTLELNALRTMQNGRWRDGAFKQLAITGASADDIPQDQVMGGPSPIVIPEGGTAQALDFTPELSQMNETLRQRSLEVAAKWGITATQYLSESTPQSGYAKRLEMDKIIAESKRRRKYCTTAEKKLYRLLALTLQEYPIDDVPALDPDAEIQIDFAEPRFSDAPGDQARTDALRLKIGIDSIVDVLGRENPDLTETDLVRLSYKKRRINQVLLTADQAAIVDLLLEAGAGVAGSVAAAGRQRRAEADDAAVRAEASQNGQQEEEVES